MALTPEGTPYVEASDLVAAYPAASLSLANRVDLVGVLPFADSAARATAIPSPSDGQYTYLQDTNSTQFWNGSAWQTAGTTPALTMVTPTSIANSGGSASLSGGAVTFTGVTSVSLNGLFTSGYNNYEIIITGFSGSVAGTNTNMRLRVAGVDASGLNYENNSIMLLGNNATDNFFGQATGFTTIRASTSSIISAAKLNINNPFQTQGTVFLGATTGVNSLNTQYSGGNLAGIHTVSTSYDGFTIFPASGNITGVIRAYGYQNS
jgi:hypothetical protein